MTKYKIFTAGMLFFCVYFNISAKAQSTGNKGLKDYYTDYFPIGASVTPALLKDPAQADLLVKNFNSITAEDAMKPRALHPEENRYYWDEADAIVDFAQKHHLEVRGHTLCWHNRPPDWLFQGKDGQPVTKEVLYARLKDHIYTVVKRYKGKIYAWDVVNEAISDDDKQFLRDSPWSQICGDEFIVKAFQYAHEADPDAILFYNEYGTEKNPKKRDRTYQLLKKLVDAKVPVHAVGIQAHWSLTEPTAENLEESIRLFSSLGLKIQFTELDVSIYPGGSKNLETTGFTPEKQQQQVELYRKVFSIFRANKQHITGVTFWNVSDKRSWLDTYPVPGRKNYPLLFDENLQPKKAFWGVVNF